MTISAVVPDIAFAGSSGSGTLGPFSLVKNGTPIVFYSNSEVVVLRYDTVTDTAPVLLVEGTDYTLTGGPSSGSITLTSPQTGLLTVERLYVTTLSALAQNLDLVNGGNFSSSNLERRLDIIFQVLQQHAREIKSSIRFAMFDTDEIPKTTPLAAVIDKIPYVTGTAANPLVDFLDAEALSDLTDLSDAALADIATVAADLTGADTIGIVASALDDIGDVADNIGDVTTVADWIGTGGGLGAGEVIATGSTEERTLADRFADVFNVLDYGATGLDATPDQSTAIFAAVAAAKAAGGGKIVFPDGVYRFKNLRVPSNVSFEAINFGKVTWKFPSSGTIAANDYLTFNENPSAFTDVNISMRGIIADGENANAGFNQTRFDALLNFARVTGLYLDRTLVKNNEYIGLAIAGCRQIVLDRPEAEACGFKGSSGTFTVTIASPAVFTRVAHGLSENLGVRFTTTGALPTGLEVGKVYYVKNVTADTFEVSATGGYQPLGSSVNTSGTQSGTHTLQTVSSNGGPAIWISNYGSDQSEDVEIIAPHIRDCVWTGLHVNATGTTVIGGVIEDCAEAGVFAPDVPGGDIRCDDIAFIGLKIRRITRRDISASGYEVGASNAKFIGCHVEDVGASGISLLDNDTVSVTGCTIKNFNQDQVGANHQGPGILVLSVASGNTPRNITITGNTITDDQGSPTGYAGITISGQTESPENIIVRGNAIDDIAWGNPSGEDILVLRAGPGCKIEGNSNAAVRGNASAGTMGGRLTLTSGQPVTTADVTAATAVYYTAHVHDVFWTWDGTAFVPSTLSGTQLGLDFTSNAAHENYQQADKNFDVFVFLDESTQGQLLGTGPAWTSDTARGTGAGTTELEYHKGVWVNKNAMRLRWGSASGNIGDIPARGGTYVGTIRMTADGQTEDSLVKRFVWNTHNRVPRPMRALEATANWTYSTAAFRQANNNTANQLAMVRGLNEDAVSASILSRVGNDTATVVNVFVNIGLDSTSTIATGAIRSAAFPDHVTNATASAEWKGYPGLGYHFLAWLERGHGSDTQTWFSNGNNGIHGEMMA